MIKTVNIKEVKSNPDNPRFIKDHKFKKLVQSLKDFPEMLEKRPMVVDENMVVLGGNMRLKACSAAGFDKVHIVIAKGWSEEQKRQFIIKDNAGFGAWDWEVLANEWNTEELEAWGIDIIGFDINQDELGTGFNTPEGDKEPFQQMTFTLADEQAEQIKNAIADIKATDEYKYCETLGNENSNGNALYLLIMQWAEQRR